MTSFDHIEAHVGDVARYCRFLIDLFQGGSCEVLAPDGTSMFTSRDGMRIEVKKKQQNELPAMVGFCNPCLRHPNPPELLSALNLGIESEQHTPSGSVYFFVDHEGVTWHIKGIS